MKYTKKFEYHIFYADESISFLNLRFENDVNMYGTQAVCWDGRTGYSLRMM